MPPEAVGGGILYDFFATTFDRSEAVSDVIFGNAVEYIGMNFIVKFGDSR